MWARMWAFSITGDRVIACKLLQLSGEPSRTRTCDPLVKSQLLYQLSYRPTNLGQSKVSSIKFQVDGSEVANSLSLWERVGVRDEVSAEEKYSLKSPSYLPERQLRGNSQSAPKQFQSQPGFGHYSAALRECPVE